MTNRLELNLPATPRAAAFARGVVARMPDIPAAVAEDLRLLLTELVTNSFRHAGLATADTIGISIDVDEARVRAEVTDRGRGFRPRRRGGRQLERASGWGLTIVERVADRWGVVSDGVTLVWFELDLRRTRAHGRATLSR